MNLNFITSRMFLGTIAAIVTTGAMLNLASKGTFGSTAKDLADYVTTGYGAGNIN